MAYNLQVRQHARDLFVESGMSYEETARETGVSLNNLKKWGIDAKWTDQREDYQREFSQFHAKIGKLKLQLVNAAIEGGDAQKVYALANLMRAGHVANGAGPTDKAALFLEFLSQLAEYVKAKNPDALRTLEPLIRGFANEVK